MKSKHFICLCFLHMSIRMAIDKRLSVRNLLLPTGSRESVVLEISANGGCFEF